MDSRVEGKLQEKLEGSLPDDATHPWAVVVHLLHAAIDLAAVGGPVLLPVTAGATPTWSAIGVADKDGFAVEPFEPRTVDIWVWPVCVVWVRFHVSPSPPPAKALILPGLLRLLLPLGRQRSKGRNTRVVLYDKKDAEVGRHHQAKKRKVEDEESNRGAGLPAMMEKEVDTYPLSENISGVSHGSSKEYGDASRRPPGFCPNSSHHCVLSKHRGWCC